MHFDLLDSGIDRNSYYKKLDDKLKNEFGIKKYNKSKINMFEIFNKDEKYIKNAVKNARYLREETHKKS